MSPRLLLGGALGFTLIFNVVWACADGVETPQDVLSVMAAAICTLIVPAALHLWPQVPAPTRTLRALRAVVMLGICASAAITSFSHSVDVLLVAGWTDLTAWSVTGGAELLVALSTMALRQDETAPDRSSAGAVDPVTGPDADRSQTAVRTVADVVVDRSMTGAAGPSGPITADRTETAPDQDERPDNTVRVTDDEVSDWIADRFDETGEIPGRKEVMDRWPIGAGRADRLRREGSGRTPLRRIQ